jgi:hypothetical protein
LGFLVACFFVAAGLDAAFFVAAGLDAAFFVAAALDAGFFAATAFRGDMIRITMRHLACMFGRGCNRAVGEGGKRKRDPCLSINCHEASSDRCLLSELSCSEGCILRRLGCNSIDLMSRCTGGAISVWTNTSIHDGGQVAGGDTCC